MANQTITGILERFQAVLEEAPLNLKPTRHPFSHENEANLNISDTYRVIAGGNVHTHEMGNGQQTRIDRVIVTLERPLDFDGYGAQTGLEDLLDTVEAYIYADGTDNGYYPTLEKGSRKVTKPKKDSDVCEASLAFLCDYDFSIETS